MQQGWGIAGILATSEQGEFTIPFDTFFGPRSHLTPADIAVDSRCEPICLQIRLKQSKTDPFRRGIDIYVGCMDNSLCPVAAMLSYLVTGGSTPRTAVPVQ